MGCGMSARHTRQAVPVNDSAESEPYKDTQSFPSSPRMMNGSKKSLGSLHENTETDLRNDNELDKERRLEHNVDNRNYDAEISLGQGDESRLLSDQGSIKVKHSVETESFKSARNEINKSSEATSRCSSELQSKRSSETESKFLTMEETENKMQEILKALERTIQTITTNPFRHFEKDGSPFTKEFRQSILKLAKSYFSFKIGEIPYSSIAQFRYEVAKVLTRHGAVRVMCDALSDGLKRQDYMDAEGKMLNEYWFPIKNILLTLLNYTDCDEIVRTSVTGHHDVLSCLVKNLDNWQKRHLSHELTEDQNKLVKWSMSILHNCASSYDSVPALRELSVIEVVLPYLDSENENIRLSTISVLALLVNEEEAQLLVTHVSIFQFIIKKLAKALHNEDRKDFGWSALELTAVLGKLARSDVNKKVLVHEGCLPPLVELLRTGDDKEIKEAIGCIWTLSFDDDNRKKMVEEPDLMKTVYDKYRTSSAAQKHDCQGILWSLREELAKSEEYRSIGEEISTLNSSVVFKPIVIATDSMTEERRRIVKVQGHVMISYQWANQEVIKQICQILRSQGIPVWIDIDYMGGSTLQAMAKAVEDAAVVIIAMSQKYKDSPNTRAEAEYTFQQRKKIIPLIMQKGYRPDGWLGLILGTKFYYDFSGKYTFESKMDALLVAVKAIIRGESMDGGDGVDSRILSSEGVMEVVGKVVSVAPLGSSLPPARPASQIHEQSVKKWTKSDIEKWLTKHSLQNSSMIQLSGEEIVFLHNLRSEAPEFFYHCLESKLHLTSLSELSNAAKALSELTL